MVRRINDPVILTDKFITIILGDFAEVIIGMCDDTFLISNGNNG
jgi:hypothetical protein